MSSHRGPQKCQCVYLLTHPSHQLLHPHVQRRCQGDEGAQARVHGGAGAGLTLLELLVGVGGDAGGVGQGFLAEALGDAGALQLQTQLAGDRPPLLVLAGGGGVAHGTSVKRSPTWHHHTCMAI